MEAPPRATPRFRLRFWGTRGTCPSPGPHTVRYGGNTPCLEVRTADDTLLVLDAGSGIRGLGARMEQDRDQSHVHVFLSHRHGDHVLGLAHFAPLLLHDRTVCLHCGNADATTLRPFLNALLSPPIFPQLEGLIARLETCDWDADGSARVGVECRVHRLRAEHPGEAAVFRIDDRSGPAIAYAPDNELRYTDDGPHMRAWRGALASQLRGVSLLVHDATYTERELQHYAGWGHSSGEEATRFALECGAGTLLLFHHHPDRSDAEIDAMLGRCRDIVATHGGTLQVMAAYEGQEFVV